MLSSGWDEDMFQRLGSLASNGNVEFRTLPVVRYDNIDGQDVNIIDPAAIKAEVASAIGYLAAEYDIVFSERADLRLSAQYTAEQSVGDERIGDFDTDTVGIKAAFG